MIRVLLVEGECHVAESIVALLRAHGVETLLCESAEDMTGLDLVRQLRERSVVEVAAGGPDATDLDLKRRTRKLERQLFVEALRRAGGRKAEASRLLGIDASNWAYHAKRLDL